MIGCVGNATYETDGQRTDKRRTLMNRDRVTLLLTAVEVTFDLLQQNA